MSAHWEMTSKGGRPPKIHDYRRFAEVWLEGTPVPEMAERWETSVVTIYRLARQLQLPHRLPRRPKEPRPARRAPPVQLPWWEGGRVS